jgi:aryl-phospho-beta-D-glucosidase BglC (GH1 family)
MPTIPKAHALPSPDRSRLRQYGLLTLLLIATLICPFATFAGTGYTTQGGNILDPSGTQVQIRGISHHGFNAKILQPEYLWQMGWKQQIAQIKSLGFNAVRLPFVPDTLYNSTPVDQLSYVEPSLNADLVGKTPLQVLDLWMAEADRQGLYVLLDFHSVSRHRQYPTWFIDNPADFALVHNNQAYTQDHWIRDLKFVAQRYAHLTHFFAIDVYNEPNGVVRWSTGDPNASNPKNFWKPAVEKAAAAVLQSNPKLLIFVQGISGNYDGIEDSGIPMNWGESFQQQAYQPLDVPADKLVLTPHTYGPDVYMKPSFGASNYPANLAADWDKLFGRYASQHPVVVGEWGGRYGQGGNGQSDVTWQNAFVDYMASKGIRSSFYWCYTPNSGDTGGILDDNLQVRQDKMLLLQRHWGAASNPAAVLAFSASAYSVAQTAGSLTVSVRRSGGSNSAASVSYSTVNGSASAGTHYTARSGTLSWPAGDTAARSISIPVSNAAPFNGSKTFSVTLSNAGSGASIGTPSSASVSISGSAAAASPGAVALSGSAYSVAQSAGQLTVSVRRNGGSAGAISVRYATADGTAKAGSDYSAKSGTLSWANGDTSSKSFSLSISKAQPFSGSRSFKLSLSNAAGGAVLGSPVVATVSITGSKVSTTPTYTQPYIDSFSPASGPVGTVVTVNGRGFTGLNQAWVGLAKNAAVSVVSDTQVRVTIPAGATTGSIGLFNPSYVSFSATSFTVSAASPTYTQPYIDSFSPASGPVGTVVTVNGRGFTGLNLAWIGQAHNGTVSVVSDTQVRVTIPAGATTGAIGLFNPSYVSFSATSFTVAP